MTRRDAYGEHWGVQPQVEYFNPRGGKVACQGKKTYSMLGETDSGNTHVGVVGYQVSKVLLEFPKFDGVSD